MLYWILGRVFFFFRTTKSHFRFILIEFQLNLPLAFVTWSFGAWAGSRGPVSGIHSGFLERKTSALSAVLCLNDMFGVTPLGNRDGISLQ